MPLSCRLLLLCFFWVHLAALASAENVTSSIFLDQVTLPTRGQIDGGLTASGPDHYFGSLDEEAPGLWRTDGTTLGTLRLSEQEVEARKVGAFPHLFYWIDRDLWRTDGTPGNEVQIAEGFGSAPAEDDHTYGGLDGWLYWLDNVNGGWDLRRHRDPGESELVRNFAREGAPSFAGAMRQDQTRLVFLAPDAASRSTGLWFMEKGDATPRLLDTNLWASQRPFFGGEAIYYAKRIDGQTQLHRSLGSPETSLQIASAGDEPFSDPREFLVESETLYFQAKDSTHGAELWQIHHGATTASRLTDLNSGNNSSSPQPLAIFQEALWTMARVGGSTRLWHVPLSGHDDAVPTRIDVLPEDVEDHHFHEAVAISDTLYLVSSRSASSDERWLTRTDGTSRGSETFGADWLTEIDSTEDGFPHLYPSDTGVFFPSSQLAFGTEIHGLGPEDDQPLIVKDANVTTTEGARAALIQSAPRSSDLLYFTLTTENEHALIRLSADGHRDDLRSGDAADMGWSLTTNNVTGITFFRDPQGLWSLQPGGGSPGLLFENATVRSETNGRHFPFTTTASGVLFLASTNGLTLNFYQSDGIVGGRTALLLRNETIKDQPVGFEGKHYFVVDKPALSVQPWTVTATGQIDRFLTFGSAVRVMGSTDSHLYFSQGNQLWSYDGRLPLLSSGAPAAVSFLVEPPVADEDDRFFYIGRDNEGIELWVTDGDLDGDERLTRLDSDEDLPLANLTALEDRVFFVAHEDATGFELWVTEGTEETTERLTDLQSGSEDSLEVNRAAPVIGTRGDYAYFAADDGVHGMELWRAHASDGTVEMVQDLVPGPGSSHPHNFTKINGRLFFQAIDPAHPLLTLREIVELPPFDERLEIISDNHGVTLRFGANAEHPYLLLDSTDLRHWQPLEAFSGEALQRTNERTFPADQPRRYYRLQRH